MKHYSDHYVRMFIGFLSTVIPELGSEIPKLSAQWERFKREVQDFPADGEVNE